MLGKKNPAVITNWRARSVTFPSERVGGSQPRFDFVEVYEWLRDSGPRSSELPRIDMQLWWEQLISAFARQATVPSPRQAMVALVLLWHELTVDTQLSAEGQRIWDDLVAVGAQMPADSGRREAAALRGALRHAAEWAESMQPTLSGLLVAQLAVDHESALYIYDLIDALNVGAELSARRRLDAILEYNVDTRIKTQLRSTGAELARYMRAVAAPQSGDTVFDPAAGEAHLLLACARQAKRDGIELRIVGQEIDNEAWAIARSRFVVAGVSADMGKPGVDSLRSTRHKSIHAQVVVIDPPVTDDGPPLDRWVDYGLACLAPEGRLVIALPLRELVNVKAARRQPSKRLESRLVELARAGMLEGILIVPRGSRTDVVGPVAVCSFRSESSAARRGNSIDEQLAAVSVIDRRVTNKLSEPDMSDLLAQIKLRGLSQLQTNANLGLEVYRINVGALWNEVEEISAASDASLARPSREAAAERRAAVRDLAFAPNRVDTPEPSVRARYEQLRKNNQELDARHQLLVNSVDGLLEALKQVEPKMDPELAKQLSYEIYRVRKALG